MKNLWSAYINRLHRKKRKETLEQQKYWETVFNAESKKSFWEVTNSKQQDIVQLLFVPNDNYSSSDTRILMTPEQSQNNYKLK